MLGTRSDADGSRDHPEGPPPASAKCANENLRCARGGLRSLLVERRMLGCAKLPAFLPAVTAWRHHPSWSCHEQSPRRQRRGAGGAPYLSTCREGALALSTSLLHSLNAQTPPCSTYRNPLGDPATPDHRIRLCRCPLDGGTPRTRPGGPALAGSSGVGIGRSHQEPMDDLPLRRNAGAPGLVLGLPSAEAPARSLGLAGTRPEPPEGPLRATPRERADVKAG